jgi:hypothetical protein
MSLTLKYPRTGYRASHPKKAKKKLVYGVSKDGIVGRWLKTNGWMTKREGKPPYKFIRRKEITKIKKKQKPPKTRKLKQLSKMSLAAKKAWKTRKKKHHG